MYSYENFEQIGTVGSLGKTKNKKIVISSKSSIINDEIKESIAFKLNGENNSFSLNFDRNGISKTYSTYYNDGKDVVDVTWGIEIKPNIFDSNIYIDSSYTTKDDYNNIVRIGNSTKNYLCDDLEVLLAIPVLSSAKVSSIKKIGNMILDYLSSYGLLYN